MKKTSTPEATAATMQAQNNAERRPRRQTIELIRQFARAYYVAAPGIAIVLN